MALDDGERVHARAPPRRGAAQSGNGAISSAFALMRAFIEPISTRLCFMKTRSLAESWMPFRPSQTSLAPSAIAATPPTTGTALAA